VSRETSAPAAPVPSALPADEGGLRLAILDLEAADRRLWSAIYLLRAASQIDDAVVALQSNDLDEADRILLNARRSFDRAYASSAEQEKGPIDTFRLQISQVRDDLHIRPEGLDRRLRQIRQIVLSLVDENTDPLIH
jgi:biopolymer transport protein ExbB/TolQ